MTLNAFYCFWFMWVILQEFILQLFIGVVHTVSDFLLYDTNTR